MRILCLARLVPWPPLDGYRTRLAHLIAALPELGEVDVFFIGSDEVRPEFVPDGLRVGHVRTPTPDARRRAFDWLTGEVPRTMAGGRPAGAVAAFAPWSRPPYDLVVMSHVTAWYHLGHLVDAPAVVDLDNLDHLAWRTRAALTWRHDRGPRSLGRAGVDLLDARRVERLIRRCAADVEAVTLCSELDVRRSGLPNAHAIPNGFEPGWEPRRDRTAVGDPPSLTFVGLLAYAPNTDAVRWMATEVLPRVRERVPAARFRVVGRQPEAVAGVAALDGVDLVGEVDTLEEEMARADVAVVPIRFGAGTRLKIPEALANRVPVVTTSVGHEGIDVIDGVHALVADDAAGFAAACVRLLEDAGLRERLSVAGAELFERSYQWSGIRQRFARLCRDVAAGVSPG